MNTTARDWGYLLRLLDPKQPVPKATKSEGTIEFWREWDTTRERAVWGKSYRNNNGYDLDAFNRAEVEWLMWLSDTKVQNTYRSASIQREGTKLAEPASYVIKTDDCGPTLDDWLRTPVRFDGSTQTHCLVQPENFLRLLQSLLEVLDGLHACHFVHCDLHPGNITIPVSIVSKTDVRVSGRIEWAKVTLIDFGYAINTRNPPRTTLPIQHQGVGVRISPHLQSILAEIEAVAKALLKAGEHWAKVWLNPAWWQRLQASPLDAFRAIDWREDIYQLGRLMADIRDGVGFAKHLEAGTIRASAADAVNHLVDTLPEELMEVGSSSEVSAERPHMHWRESIDLALYQARSLGQPYRSDFCVDRADFAAAPVPNPDRDTNETYVEPRVSDRAQRPDWAKKAAMPALPTLVPLRAAAPSGWQLAIARAPITWRQWQAVSALNPELARPGWLSKPQGVPEALWDTPVTEVSHSECLAYIDALNHLGDLYNQDPMARYRVPTASEWALAATGSAWPKLALDSLATNLPVSQWPVNAQGLAGMRGHLWHWLEAQSTPGWAPVRGGCHVQTPEDPGDPAGPMDQFPIDWKSPFITLRLACFLPTHKAHL